MDVAEVVQRAQLLTDLGQLQSAAELLLAALDEDPHDAALQTQMAVVAFRAGDLGNAYTAARAAIETAPTAPTAALEVMARVLLAADLDDRAVEVARQVVQRSPTDADAHMLLATCLSYTASARRESVTEIDRALELRPGDAGLLVEAARLSDRMGDGRAAEFIAAGLEADPANADLQAMAARGKVFAREQVSGLTAVLAEDPTHRLARHGLAQVVWGTVARLASGVWIYALAAILLSAWVSPGVLRHAVPVLMAPLVCHWIGVFLRVRRQLPRGYLARRLRRSPSAAIGIGLAAIAAVIANFSPIGIVRGWDSDGVRMGYQALIFACLVAGLAHLLVTLGRIRADGDVHLPTHLEEQSGYWLVWLLGFGVPTAVCWASYRLVAQPGALWFALMLVPIVLAVRCIESTIAMVRVGTGTRALTVLAATLCVAVCAGLVWWCGHRAAGVEFRYTEGPLSPGHIPTFPSLPPLPTFTPGPMPTP